MLLNKVTGVISAEGDMKVENYEESLKVYVEVNVEEVEVENGFKLEYLNEYKFKKGISLWKWLLAILRKLR